MPLGIERGSEACVLFCASTSGRAAARWPRRAWRRCLCKISRACSGTQDAVSSLYFPNDTIDKKNNEKTVEGRRWRGDFVRRAGRRPSFDGSRLMWQDGTSWIWDAQLDKRRRRVRCLQQAACKWEFPSFLIHRRRMGRGGGPQEHPVRIRPVHVGLHHSPCRAQTWSN